MFTQIGAKRESDFSEPLGMLSDCHKRIQYFLEDLSRLAEHALHTQLSAVQHVALERALRYFQESGPRHTSDEEDSLFPRLRAMKDSRLNEILIKIEALEADHKEANDAHNAVDAIGVRWLADGTIATEEAARLKSLLQHLSRIYAHHLAVEDMEIFPAAAALLSNQAKKELGREMAKRRGLSPEIVKHALQRADQLSEIDVEAKT